MKKAFQRKKNQNQKKKILKKDIKIKAIQKYPPNQIKVLRKEKKNLKSQDTNLKKEKKQ